MKNVEKPYEKFLEFGPESLTEAELLAIIIRTGTTNKDALTLAKEVLNRYGGILGLYDMNLANLTEVRGIGEVKAVKLLCITELSKRIAMADRREGVCFQNPASVASYFMEMLRHRGTECVVLVCIDNKGSMISHSILSTGSVKRSLISPREVFLTALEKKAVNIILLHNHPSGDPTPSDSDAEITQSVYQMGKIIDIPLLDHIIIGDKVYYSFLQEGQLG